MGEAGSYLAYFLFLFEVDVHWVGFLFLFQVDVHWVAAQVDVHWVADHVKAWVDDIPQLKDGDYHVFARSAFGNLYAWRSDSGRVVRIACSRGYILTDKKLHTPMANKCIKMQTFFAAATPAGFDLLDESEMPLFDRALDTLGALQRNEVYGFEPLLAAGGKAKIENLRRLRIDVHLDIMKQFTKPVLRLV